MTRTSQNFEMWAGDSKKILATITDADTGSGTSLSSMDIEWGLYALDDMTKATATALLSKASSGSGIVISGCLMTISLQNSDTATLGGLYYHEAQVTLSGSPTTIFTGVVRINQSLVV
jgi:hypothetical protein